MLEANNSRSADGCGLSGSAVLSKPSTPWAILTALYHNRDKFSDVEIKCLDGKKIQAHKAILAARERFFADIFFPQAQELAHPRARRAAKAMFPEESSVLQSIIEYLYTGVIDALETAPRDVHFPDAEGRLWIKTIMWCSRHDVKSVFDYVHFSVLDRLFSPTCAAELLALVAHSAGAAAQTGTTPSEQLRARQIDELKQLAISSFVSAPFREDIFAPLSRVALKVLLQSNRLAVREFEVVRAVGWWSQNSAWVRNNVEAGVLTAENMTDVTSLLNPDQLTGQEFRQCCQFFPVNTHAETWRKIVMIQTNRMTASISREMQHAQGELNLRSIASERSRSSLLALSEVALNARDRHSSSLSRALRSATLSSSISENHMPPSRESSMNYSRPVPASMAAMPPLPRTPEDSSYATRVPNAPVQGQFERVGMFEQELTGNVAPAAPTLNQAALSRSEIREMLESAARSNPNDPLSAFHFGSGMEIQEVAGEPYVTLVSSDTTHHQSMLYKVGITSGTLRWSLEVVRPCDMLWMGVSAEFNLDTSQWAARHPGVWMASEESSCLAHISEYTGLNRINPDHVIPMHPAHVGLTRLPCVRCILMDPDQDDDAWSFVVAELRIVDGYGELWMDVNRTGMQLVFHSLPTDRPLYPVVSVINAMQVKFTHLE